jgi:arabinose-5-phosphate isomerase
VSEKLLCAGDRNNSCFLGHVSGYYYARNVPPPTGGFDAVSCFGPGVYTPDYLALALYEGLWKKLIYLFAHAYSAPRLPSRAGKVDCSCWLRLKRKDWIPASAGMTVHRYGVLNVQFDLEFARNVILSEASAIETMAGRIVDESFARAAGMVLECKGSIIVTGIGKAGIIGRKISATLASTGTPSHFLHPAEAVHGDLGRLRKEDIVLVLSYGGETDEITRLINLVKQLEIRLIALTGNCDSALAKHSDIVLCMGQFSEACPLGVAPSVTTTCMLAAGDALAFTVMKARNFGVEDFARFHPGGSLGARLITVEQSMMFRPGEKLPLARVSDTVERLLDSSKDVKRHGAVMVVNGGGMLAGIITDADLRRLFAKHGVKAMAMPVGDVMTANCKRIRSDALAAEAMALFHKFRIDELPVVDAQDRPVGLIDVQDIVAIKIVG